MNKNISDCKVLSDRIFHSNNYITEGEVPKNAINRFLHYRHLTFVSKFLILLFKAKKIADAGNYNTEEWIKSSYNILKLTEKVGANYRIENMENIDKNSEPTVFVSNHMSTLETMIFPCLLASKKETTFVVKDSLISHPLFGSIMRARKPIVVGRESSREDLIKVMTEGQEKLKNGISVVIFPQSSRRNYFKAEEFNSLGIKLAKKAGVKILPIAIKTDFWANGKYIKDLGKLDRKKTVHINFGEEMEIKGNGKEQHNEIINFIQTNYDKWVSELAKHK